MAWLVGSRIYGCFAISLICAVMINRRYDIMLDQLNARLPEGQKIKRPFLSHKWPQIVSLHGQYYPGSRVGAENRFLFRVFVISFGIMALVAIGWVIPRGQLHP